MVKGKQRGNAARVREKGCQQHSGGVCGDWAAVECDFRGSELHAMLWMCSGIVYSTASGGL